MLSHQILLSCLAAIALSAPVYSTTTSEVAFPTSNDVGYPGVTATNIAPFLAQTDPVAVKFGTPSSTYSLPQPIETALQGLSSNSNSSKENIFHHMGTLSPYYTSEGFGVYNYGTPDQCRIVQLHSLSRHGSRYPTDQINVHKILENRNFTASGELEFLNSWNYTQGVNLLTKLGNQQLFLGGVRSFMRYGQLYDFSNPEKIVARTTSQDRITKSAEYFLSGFFGLDFEDYVNLEIIIESDGFNNTLAPYDNCPLYSDENKSAIYANYMEKYLDSATKRINSKLNGLTLNVNEVFQMQQLCAYETSNNGFSYFCNLFTAEEWENYEYYNSWTWYDGNSFGSPQGRALGSGWVEEFKQRLTKTEYNPAHQSNQNSTFDSNPLYFPTNQTVYFDFSHDSVITNIFTALGFETMKSNFTIDGKLNSPEAPFQLSKYVPFASQTYFEVIECDEEISAERKSNNQTFSSGPSKYIHMILNDNSYPLDKAIPSHCEERVDGWCKFDLFVEYLDTLWEKADFNEACFTGHFANSIVTDGAPIKK